MIQRIQSIWLILASVCAFLSLKLPFYSGTGNIVPSQFQLLNGASHFGLLLVTVIIGMLAIFAIFDYKTRVRQLRLCAIGILLEGILIFLYYHFTSTFTAGTYSLTAILQAGVMLFFVLAIRGIQNDNKLVKDSDRLR
jgi:hypothetical protein